MSQLNLQKSTIGYNSEQITTAVSNLNVKCVDNVGDILDKGIDKLEEAIDAVWVGHSADTFKNNIKSDKNYIKDQLFKVGDNLRIEIENIMIGLQEIDESIVTAREVL